MFWFQNQNLARMNNISTLLSALLLGSLVAGPARASSVKKNTGNAVPAAVLETVVKTGRTLTIGGKAVGGTIDQ